MALRSGIAPGITPLKGVRPTLRRTEQDESLVNLLWQGSWVTLTTYPVLWYHIT